jgi:dinuclear metal center YbgI/SA1388 family protein
MAKRRTSHGEVKRKEKAQTSLSIGEVLSAIEIKAPLTCSEDWDNVGLLVGKRGTRVSSAVVSIDLTHEAIDLAIRRKSNLIVNHHPCIFPKSKGLSKLTARCKEDGGSPSSELVYRAIENGISVAAFHTNFDQCSLEVVKAVSNGLGVEARGRLLDKSRGSLARLVTFVPRDHAEAVRNALCEAGAGHIGNYDSCTFTSEGIGTFRGNKFAQPYLGKAGFLERAQEVRLETVFPAGLERQIVKSLLSAHPYEEVAYDIYSVKQAPTSLGLVRGLGYGFWGEFKSPKPFSEVAKDVKHLFRLDGFWLTNPPPSRVRKLAFVAGKGASFIDAAVAAGCDLFITGEAGYHVALDGARKGMAVMELGHRESERFFLTTMEGWLAEQGVRSFSATEATQKIYR